MAGSGSENTFLYPISRLRVKLPPPKLWVAYGKHWDSVPLLGPEVRGTLTLPLPECRQSTDFVEEPIN